MNTSARAVDRRRIGQIADEDRSRGYKVVIEPTGATLPQFLADFHPDIIAYGPQDSVVVEVKVGTETAVSERYRELAERIRQQPGWRFSLVVVDSRSDEMATLVEELLAEFDQAGSKAT